MTNIQDYMYLSDSAKSIKDSFIQSDDFYKKYWGVFYKERDSFVRHFIVNNIPFAFREKPILYEQITQYMADKLIINTSEIKLIGSAKTGFSLSPPPDYGRNFGIHSDLDFSIINEVLFCKIEKEYKNWCGQFSTGEIKPRNETEEKYWYENLTWGTSQINNGFFDTNKIPNFNQFVLTQKINNSLSLIKINLVNIHSLTIRKVSASIYKNWESFTGRLNRNTRFVMDKVNQVK